MKHWLRSAPDWLHGLASGDVDDRSAVRLRWLSQADSEEEKEVFESVWEYQSYDRDFTKACRKRLKASAPVAVGPERTNRLVGNPHAITLLFDPGRPETLWATLGRHLPPPLWFPVGTTLPDIAAALAPYLVEKFPAVAELPRVHRAFMGTADSLGIDGLASIENHVVMNETWIDPPMWGSAYDDDPWPPAMKPIAVPAQVVALREHMRQVDGRWPSTSFRSLWTRSVVTFEQQVYDAFVLQARYRPARHADVIRAFNAQFGLRLPEDAPMDVAASFVVSGAVPASVLEEALRGKKPDAGHLLGLAAVSDRGPVALEAMRRLVREGKLLEAVVEVADAFKYDGFLHELLAETRNPELAAELERVLDPAYQPEQEDA